VSVPAFELPRRLEAHEPPEARGLARDEVRLLVAGRRDGGIAHTRFRDLPELLTPGDLLVVNDSATLPAALDARRADGTALTAHLSSPAPGVDAWFVELRAAGGSAPFGGARSGERLALDGGATLELLARYARGPRLWLARVDANEPVTAYLAHHGRPIRYGYVPSEWPLAAYQTAYALHPGSAEMPSAGRPFTPELITRLVAGGVLIAPITLHTGVSSAERGEPPYPERLAVPATTARLVNAVRGWGGRVVAVGTTVVRALESATREDGTVAAAEGWTKLVVTGDEPLRAVDGLLTGWHEPEATHLAMLRAVAGDELLHRSYRAALEAGYLWHEFGDAHLILP